MIRELFQKSKWVDKESFMEWSLVLSYILSIAVFFILLLAGV